MIDPPLVRSVREAAIEQASTTHRLHTTHIMKTHGRYGSTAINSPVYRDRGRMARRARCPEECGQHRTPRSSRAPLSSPPASHERYLPPDTSRDPPAESDHRFTPISTIQPTRVTYERHQSASGRDVVRDLGRPLRPRRFMAVVRQGTLAGVGWSLPCWQSTRPDRLDWSPPLLHPSDVLDDFIRGRTTIEQMSLPEYQLPVFRDAGFVDVVPPHLLWSQTSTRAVGCAGSNILVFDGPPLPILAVRHPHLTWWGGVVRTMTRPARLLLPAELARDGSVALLRVCCRSLADEDYPIHVTLQIRLGAGIVCLIGVWWRGR